MKLGPRDDGMSAWGRLLVVCGAVALFSLAWIFMTANIPWEDDFDAILRYLSYPANERWRHVIDLHNEHRIVTTRLIAELVTLVCGHVNFRGCMLVGNCFMLLLAAMWHKRFRKANHEWLGLAVFVLSLSLLHWANQLNALCANQNILAVLLPFLSLTAAQRQDKVSFACGMAIAVLATFTSGSGIFVWPALFLAEFAGRRRKKRLALVTVLAIAVLCLYFSLPDNRPPQVIKDVAKPGETLLARTTVMGYVVEITPMFVVRHLAYAANYFLACVGGLVVLPWLNVAVGGVLCLVAIWLTLTMRKIRDVSVFGLMIYLLGGCASCGIFRASCFGADVPSRYQVVCVSLAASIVYLALERLPDAAKTWRLERAACLFACFASAAYFVYAAPILHARAEIHRRNILLWPSSDMGLRYLPDERKPHASAILRESVDRGIYLPQVVANPGETPPAEPLDDVTPLF